MDAKVELYCIVDIEPENKVLIQASTRKYSSQINTKTAEQVATKHSLFKIFLGFLLKEKQKILNVVI